jgi:TPR repeat protein
MVALLLVGSLAGGTYWWHQRAEQIRTQSAHASLVARGDSLLHLAKYDSALAAYRRALTLLPNDTAKRQSERLAILVPAMRDFYGAKYASAYRQLAKAAQMGSGDASYYQGELIFNGLGTRKDYAAGLKATQKAAKLGFPMAYYRLAIVYQDGEGAPKNQRTSDSLYLQVLPELKRLAEAGDPEAQANLGSLYASGRGLTKNDEMAFEWWEKAAKKGYAFAQMSLASMYLTGQGVAKDARQAVAWYDKAAQLGDPNAQAYLAGLLFAGKQVTADPDRALALAQQAAAQQFAYGHYVLGEQYYSGEKIALDYDSAYFHLKKAVELDNENAAAKQYLALLYYQGKGTSKNYPQAVRMFNDVIKTARAQNETAWKNQTLFLVANIHRTGGHGLDRDQAEAYRLMREAANDGYVEAQYTLGMWYLDNPSTVRQGAEWLVKAAQNGHPKANRLLRGVLLYQYLRELQKKS